MKEEGKEQKEELGGSRRLAGARSEVMNGIKRTLRGTQLSTRGQSLGDQISVGWKTAIVPQELGDWLGRQLF